MNSLSMCTMFFRVYLYKTIYFFLSNEYFNVSKVLKTPLLGNCKVKNRLSAIIGSFLFVIFKTTNHVSCFKRYKLID